MSQVPTRRLPAWIPAAPAIIKSANVSIPMVRTAGSVDVSCETDEQCSTVRTGDEPRRWRRIKSDEHEKLVSTGRRQRAKKLKSSKEADTHDGADDVMSNTGENDEVRRELQGQVPRRRRNVKVNRRRVDRGSDTSLLHDDEIELTVEDLLTIAEEYIKSYNDALRPLGESTSECGGRLTAPENVDGSHHSTSALTEKSSEGGVPGPRKVVEALSDEEVVAGAANKSGDPAREMLDLLLGPLLKKPKGGQNELIGERMGHYGKTIFAMMLSIISSFPRIVGIINTCLATPAKITRVSKSDLVAINYVLVSEADETSMLLRCYFCGASPWCCHENNILRKSVDHHHNRHHAAHPGEYTHGFSGIGWGWSKPAYFRFSCSSQSSSRRVNT